MVVVRRVATANRLVAGLLFWAVAVVRRTASIPTLDTSPSGNVCMPSDCTWSDTHNPNYNTFSCYTVSSSQCPSGSGSSSSLDMTDQTVYLPIPGRGRWHFELFGPTYYDSLACIWRFPPLADCEEYEILVYDLELTTSGTQDCTCEDHLLLHYKGSSADETQKACMNKLNLPDEVVARVYRSLGNFTLMFRTDASGNGKGYNIIVYKNTTMTTSCTQNMGEPQHTDFEIVKIPPIAGCPSFLFDKVLEARSSAIKNIEDNGDVMQSLAPPLDQCYCFGTCTAKTANDRLAAIGKLLPLKSFTPYLNSPDPALRKISRAAKKISDEEDAKMSG